MLSVAIINASYDLTSLEVKQSWRGYWQDNLEGWHKELVLFWPSLKSKQSDFERMSLPLAPKLYRLAFSRLGNAADAEDVVQETYLKAFRAFKTFREGTNIQAWMTQILINTIRDHTRKTAKAPPLVGLEDLPEGISLEELVHDTMDPSRIYEDSHIDADLVKAIRSLPETLLTPWLLRELQDLSYKDIAQAIDVPIGTVMSRLSRARQLIRKLLAGAECAQTFAQDAKDAKVSDAEGG